MEINTIIFDLGNVLIDWSPSHLYDKIFHDKKEKEYFLKKNCNMEWHSLQDAGRSPQDATEELVKQHPEYAQPIRAFYTRWKEMFGGPIEGSVQILKELKEKGYRLYALSNWNVELYNQTVDDYPFLQWFDGKVLSGEEKLIKPDAKIFRLLIKRFDITPQQAVFIDDNKHNVAAAEKVGIKGIRFVNAGTLRQQLTSLAIL